MLKVLKETFKRNAENKNETNVQKEFLLTKAWVLHFIKTVYLLIRLTFDQKAYWKRDYDGKEHF